MLTTKQILDIAMNAGTSGAAGKVEAARRFGLKSGKGNQMAPDSAAQGKFLADVAATPASTRPAAYLHPGDGAPVGNRHQWLSASDLAWLARLPTDPANVPFDDARTIAGMIATYATTPVNGEMAPPADRRYLRAVWAPIKAFHDKNAAKAACERAKAPLTPVPSSTLPALAAAIKNETPTLTDDEAMGRASEALQAALDQRANDRDQELQRAQAAITQVDTDTAERVAVTRTVTQSRPEHGFVIGDVF